RLFTEGEEVALAITAGNAIEFYGKAPSPPYAKYAKHNVYWLTTSGGSGSPKRMAELDGTPGEGTVPSSHTFSLHDEQDLWYWLAAPGDDSLDRWFSTYIYGPGIHDDLHSQDGGLPVPLTLTLPGVSAQGSLKLRLCGVYDTEHEVAVTVNGTPMGSMRWSGIAFHEESFAGAPFLEGANTVSLQCLSGTDEIALDWMEATYPRAFSASGDSLKFTSNGSYRFEISGFTGSELELFDLTSPLEPKRIMNFQVSTDTVSFEPGETGERTYLVLGSSAVKTPAGITRDTASTLASSANGADYILVTHRLLGWDGGGSPQHWLTSLVTLRESQGLRVKVLDVQDIFDEFSYGISSPQAVKDFLAYAYASWQRPAPQYVLLVGDATFDPKGNYGWIVGDTTATYLP
ncbi:MAG TPA: C25 family cysteine peptidase, partial [Methanomicrobiales archaeon]|nr:C25 family cysteine peptidase [Methanomicrobiales archaeon]